MRPGFIGIDAAFAKNKRLPVSICTWRGERLVPEPLRRLSFEPPRGSGNSATLDSKKVDQFAREATAYIFAVCPVLRIQPHRIAIDAPSAPRRQGIPRRTAEVAMNASGISCFATPSASEFDSIRTKVSAHLASGGAESHMPHANQLWMLVGFSLFKHLSEVAPCIEVFPQATARALGTGQIHKSDARGLAAQLSHASSQTGWPSDCPDDPDFEEIAWAPAPDRLDAYLCAWVAALPEEDRVAFGDPPDDVIWVPKIDVVPPGALWSPVRQVGHRRVEVNRTRPSVRATLLCPACSAHEFKRWPWGWDSHAAFRCRGLAGQDPGERKREFRLRFGDLLPRQDTHRAEMARHDLR